MAYQRILIVVVAIGMLIGCTPRENTSNAIFSTPLPALSPSPQPDLTITGIIADVATSARTIMLHEPVQGFTKIALVEPSIIIPANGEPVKLHLLQPGMQIEATGWAEASSALLTSEVRILSQAAPSDGS
ncbi:MAG: hypothetical protein MI924_07895 [Chloroflexales bacterium]|nr:hypothetical protein [Chloroflexales bacterium]